MDTTSPRDDRAYEAAVATYVWERTAQLESHELLSLTLEGSSPQTVLKLRARHSAGDEAERSWALYQYGRPLYGADVVVVAVDILQEIGEYM